MDTSISPPGQGDSGYDGGDSLDQHLLLDHGPTAFKNIGWRFYLLFIVL
jgi:hypothetical protein